MNYLNKFYNKSVNNNDLKEVESMYFVCIVNFNVLLQHQKLNHVPIAVELSALRNQQLNIIFLATIVLRLFSLTVCVPKENIFCQTGRFCRTTCM